MKNEITITTEYIKLDSALKLAGLAMTGGEAKTAVQTALTDWFSGVLLGKSVLLAELNSLIFRTAGVKNCRITLPEADLAAAEGVLPVLGTLTFTEMGA